MALSADQSRYAQVKRLFHKAVEVPVDQQEEWLRTHCEDTELREEVATLLAAHADVSASDYLDNLLLRKDEQDPLEGVRIGPWQLKHRIGSGGMGVVYHACRADGLYERDVALKVLHPGRDAENLVNRFRAERRILASLEHPHIARLYDGGVTEAVTGLPGGLPWFAMEFVEGASLTEYVSELPLHNRLKIFLQVCDAVAYAHRNLIVHRDLKPSNILVEDKDEGLPSVRLLDFGIAKLLEGSPDEIETQTGARMLTPAYAAPEQLRGGPITTATDVYALGVILYELLTDCRPYDLAGKTASQIEEIIAAKVPEKPSDVAKGPFGRSLTGDLDQIILKALAKEPERRYASADALAEDIERHFGGVPIAARPATVGYRVRKFVARHRVGVAAAALVFVAVIGGAGVSAWQAHSARIAQAEAEEHAVRAEAIAGFLEQILRAPNDRWYVDAESKGPDTPIRTVLDEAASRIDRDFADQPDLRADLHHIIGDTYLSMGMMGRASLHHRTVLALRESLYTAPHPEIAEALYYAAGVEANIHTQFGLFERAAAMLRQNPGGNNLPFILSDLAGKYNTAGFPVEAERLYVEAMDFVRNSFVHGTDGFRYREQMLGRLALGLVDVRLERNDFVGAGHWLTATDESKAVGNHACILGRWYRARNEFYDAERLYQSCERADPAASNVLLLSRVLANEPAALLVELYEAWGRPSDADQFRARAEAYKVDKDSLNSIVRFFVGNDRENEENS